MKERPMPIDRRSNARRRGCLLWLAAAVSLVASCANGDLFIEVSPDCAVALPGSSPSCHLELSHLEGAGSQAILLRDSTGADTTALLRYWNMGFSVDWIRRAWVNCPGWISHEIYHGGDTLVRCAPLRAEGTVALIAREDGRVEEVRVPIWEQRVVDLGSGHRVLINGFSNVGVAVKIMGVGGLDHSDVLWNFGGEWLGLPTDGPTIDAPPEVAIESDGRTYCVFLDIFAGQPRFLSAEITQ